MRGILLSILGILILLYIALCLIMYFKQEIFIFRRYKIDKDYKFKFNQADEVWLRNESGDSINALHFKTSEPKGVILYFHGNSGALDKWGGVAKDFRSLDYDVFIIDYPGFGKSTGSISEKKLFTNARLTYDHLLKQYNSNEIIIYGRSIGSGVATKLASTTKAKALILESPFYRLDDLIGFWMKFFPGKILLKYPFRNDLHIQHVDYPVWIVHGTADKVVPLSSGIKLEKYLENDHFIILQNAGHNDIREYDEYHMLLEKILN